MKTKLALRLGGTLSFILAFQAEMLSSGTEPLKVLWLSFIFLGVYLFTESLFVEEEQKPCANASNAVK